MKPWQEYLMATILAVGVGCTMIGAALILVSGLTAW